MTQKNIIEISAAELTQHGEMACPNPKAGMELWNGHPRVFLNLAHGGGSAQCPYCGAVYRMKDGESLASSH